VGGISKRRVRGELKIISWGEDNLIGGGGLRRKQGVSSVGGECFTGEGG